MAKRRRLSKIPTPAWEPPRGAIGRRILGRSSQFYATVLIVLAVGVALGIVAFAYISDYVADLQRPGSTALQVEDTRYTLRYYAQRLRMYVDQVGGPANQSAQPQVALAAVTEQLVEEEVLRRFAPELGVSASEEEVHKEIARRLGIKPDEKLFDVLFQQELERSGLSEEEYRQMSEAAVLRQKVRSKLAEDLPQSAESVRYRQILVSDQDAADEIVQKLEEGEDFAQLAQERSLDIRTRDAGGDVGWVPRGVLDQTVEETLFALDVGEIETIPSVQGVLVVEVLDKAEDRPIEPAQRERLADKAYQEWVQEKRALLEVKDFVRQDSDKLRWAIDHAYPRA